MFSGNSHFNCWCIFSDIYDSSHCTRVGEQSSVWISGFLQKIHKIWPPPRNVSLITYFHQFLSSTLEVISQWQLLILKHGNSVYHEFKTILKSEWPQILVKMCVTLRHYALNLMCHDSVNVMKLDFFTLLITDKASAMAVFVFCQWAVPVAHMFTTWSFPVSSQGSVIYSEVIFRSVKIWRYNES